MSRASQTLDGCAVLPPMEPPTKRGASRSPSRRPRTGRFATLNAFVDASMRGLSGTAVKVWLIIYRDTKPSGLATVSDADMARRAGVTTRSIHNARKQLVSAGLLTVVRKGRLGGGASMYRVRGLVAEARFQNQPEARFQNSRKPASSFPEGDQKSRPDSFESGDLQKARNLRAARSAKP